MTKYKYILENHHFIGLKNPLKGLLCLLMIALCGMGYAQTITLPNSKTTIGAVISEIENQTEYRFFYEDKLDTSIQVNIPVKTQSINELLGDLFKNTSYDFKIGANIIGIKHNPNKDIARVSTNPVVQVVNDSESQTQSNQDKSLEKLKTLSGVVLDVYTGKPLAGVGVVVKGRDVIYKTKSGENGEFRAEELPLGEYGIIFSSKDHRIKREHITLTETSEANIAFRLEQADMSSMDSSSSLTEYNDNAKWLDINAPLKRPAKTVLSLPKFALKTNLALWATSSMNLGFELRLSDKTTLDFPISYNPWKFSNNKLLRHFLLQPEVRYWTRESFNGHFVGFNLMYAFFNVGNVKVPFGLFKDLRKYRYEGNLYGAGISYGYQWILSNRISLEATVGVGYLYADYDKYECQECAPLIGKDSKHYVGLTKIGISFSYFFR